MESTARGEEAEPVYFKRSVTGNSARYQTFFEKLPPCKRDQTVKVVFVLRNDTSDDLHLDSVDISCKCTEAKVPKSAVEPGHSAPIEVTVRTESWLRDTRQVFDVNINCRGAYSKIELRFVADFVELCQFPHHDYSFSMSDDSEVEDFSLPLMVSSDIDAAKLTLSPRDDFEGWTAQIERKENKSSRRSRSQRVSEQTKTFLESSYCSMTAKSRVAPCAKFGH